MITVVDEKYRYAASLNPETGFSIRTSIYDREGNDTGIDPFMASFPELLDVGIMGHCIHGKTGLCVKAGIGCYQSGLTVEQPNMALKDFINTLAIPDATVADCVDRWLKILSIPFTAPTKVLTMAAATL